MKDRTTSEPRGYDYVWELPCGEEVIIESKQMKVFEIIDRVFPGAKVTWWRRPPKEGWKRP